jgi:flagellar biosynthesis/type III secretory pathway chaperone
LVYFPWTIYKLVRLKRRLNNLMRITAILRRMNLPNGLLRMTTVMDKKKL